MPAPSLAGFNQKVVVGIAEMAVSNERNVTLATGEVCLKISGQPRETILCKNSTTT